MWKKFKKCNQTLEGKKQQKLIKKNLILLACHD